MTAPDKTLAFAPAMLRSRTTARYRAKRQDGRGACLVSAKAALAGFAPGDHIFGVSAGQFSMIDLADAALGIAGPADVTVWTWCIADYEVEVMTTFMADGRIRTFRLVIDWAGSQRDTELYAFGLDTTLWNPYIMGYRRKRHEHHRNLPGVPNPRTSRRVSGEGTVARRTLLPLLR